MWFLTAQTYWPGYETKQNEQNYSSETTTLSLWCLENKYNGLNAPVFIHWLTSTYPCPHTSPSLLQKDWTKHNNPSPTLFPLYLGLKVTALEGQQLKIYPELTSKKGWGLMNTQGLLWLQPARASSRTWYESFAVKREYSLHTGVEKRAVTVSPNMFFFNSKWNWPKTLLGIQKNSAGLSIHCAAHFSPRIICHHPSLSKVM